jgi:hypothetical protein
MSENLDPGNSEAANELEREIRNSRKFTLAEAIGRLAGPGALKGASPIARKQQAELEIESFLGRFLADASGALKVVLLRRVNESELLHTNPDQPFTVLANYCQLLLGSDYSLKELVREVDTEWGRILGERPHFEKEGLPPDPDDCYTVESVRNTLSAFVKQLTANEKAGS